MARRRNAPTLRARRSPAATRWRIAEAAVERFSTHGYAATTLKAIAADARVHEQTVYLVFGTKLALLAAAFDLVRAGGEDPERQPSEWPWARALIAEPDPPRLLRRFAAHVREIAPRAGPLVAELRSAARANPELAAFLAHRESDRYLGPAGVVALLAERGALRRGLAPERAADTLYAVASYEGYELLVRERGFTPEAYERWLADVLCALLLDPRPSSRRTASPRRSASTRYRRSGSA